MWEAVKSFGLSVRRACRVIGFGRSSQQYAPQERGEGEIRQRLRDLAERWRAFGSPQLCRVLNRERRLAGLPKVNHKRVERLYRLEGLSLRRRKHKKMAAGLRVILPKPLRANERWSMDFVQDTLWMGRRFRSLTIVDDFSRECPAIEVDTSLGGARVAQVLDRLAVLRGLPEVITTDNGPEFISQALDEWAYRHGVKLHFIRPGKPVENAFIESFNGTFRKECLNQHWFSTLAEARQIIEHWRLDYNRLRPHSSLDDLTPEEFSAREKLKYAG